jgi:hypothetical protein
MEQVFAATIHHGSIGANHRNNTYWNALVDAASHPDRNDKMLRYLLGEMIESVFDPKKLDSDIYGNLLTGLDFSGPIRCNQVEVISISRSGIYPPTIKVYALFVLPVAKEITNDDWHDVHCDHASIADAINFYWTFPWSSKSEGAEPLYPLVADQINFMPIAC